MKERPILFTPENAQKVFDGSKSQTRRIMKPQPSWVNMATMFWKNKVGMIHSHKCPYGVVGDRLWIRENGWDRPERTPKMLRDGADTWERFYYDALLDDGEAEELKGYGFKRRPSIHMPRWACRTVVELTEIRVERLDKITESDSQAEGVKSVAEFMDLWVSINKTWEPSLWVWVLEFRKVSS